MTPVLTSHPEKEKEDEGERERERERERESTKKHTWTHNEDSDQPDHPSCLNRIPNSSCVVIMGSQGPKAFSRNSEYYWNSAWRMGNNVVFVVLRHTCYSCYVISWHYFNLMHWRKQNQHWMFEPIEKGGNWLKWVNKNDWAVNGIYKLRN